MDVMFKRYSDDKGFALPFVILVSFLITSAVIAFLYLLHLQNLSTVRQYNHKRLELACYSAVQSVMVSDSIKNDRQLSYMAVDSIPVELHVRLNGLFYEVTARAAKFKDSAKLRCLIAAELSPEISGCALVISKPELRAAYAGANNINGDILAASADFSPGLITGLQTKPGLIESGKLRVSKTIREKLFLDSLFLLMNKKTALRSGQNQNGARDLYFTENMTEELMIRKNIYVTGDLHISGKLKKFSDAGPLRFFVRGKTVFEDNTQSELDIEIYCDSSLWIGRNAGIKNLTGRFSGDVNTSKGGRFLNCQLYSRRSISLDGSDFLYPSIAGMYTDVSDAQSMDNQMKLTSTTFNGTLFLLSSNTGFSTNRSCITLDEISRVQGVVYSENYVNLQGSIKGLVYTYSFYYYSSPSEYIDWLISLDVNRGELSDAFLAPLGFERHPRLAILEAGWIY